MHGERLALGCDLNTVTWPLYEGIVEPKGVDLNFHPFDDLYDLFDRMFVHGEFDAAELFMSSYFIALDQGIDDFVAIPVFPSRVFRHGFIFVNDDAGIDDPGDLAGKRVGVPSYSMTAAVWERAVLQHEYGVHPSEMQWIQREPQGGGEDDPLTIDLLEEIDIETKPPERTLDGMLADGDLDALAAPSVPSTYDGGTVRRLFPDYRTVEREYYERTGYFPIMHVVVIRRDVFEEHRWVASALTNAFTEAKEYALDTLRSSSRRKIAVPWIYEHLERVHETFDDDYWPYGVEANREVLDAMAEFEHEQGLTSQKIEVDELFAPTVY